jgi:hypothetical protein
MASTRYANDCFNVTLNNIGLFANNAYRLRLA